MRRIHFQDTIDTGIWNSIESGRPKILCIEIILEIDVSPIKPTCIPTYGRHLLRGNLNQ
jgi:hypothetical protein